MFALGALLAAAFIPWTWGAATSPRWAVVAVLPAVLLLALEWTSDYRSRAITPLHVLAGTLVAWSALSLLWSASLWDGLNGLFQCLFLGVSFLLGTQPVSLRRLNAGLAVGVAASSVLVLIELSSLHPDWTMAPMRWAGLFINSNTLCEFAVLVLVSCAASRMYWALPLLLPSVVLPTGRGAWLGGMAALTLWGWRRYKWATALCVAVGVPVLVLSVHQSSTIVDRLFIWRDTASSLTFWGHGLGSFAAIFPYLDTTHDALRQRVEHAHNDFLQVVFEMGAVGGLLVVGLVATIWRTAVEVSNYRQLGPHYYVLEAFAVEACVSFPLHLPGTAFLAAFMLGRVAADWDWVCWRSHISGSVVRAGPVDHFRQRAYLSEGGASSVSI